MKTIVITGASDGIGAVAVGLLTRAGHRVIPVGRSVAKTRSVAEQAGVEQWLTADFEKLSEVRALAERLRECAPRIDVLANNAGGLFSGPVRTVDGFERTIQVNHLAPFLLTYELRDVLVRSQAAVVNTSSIGARLFGQIDLDDLNGWSDFHPNRAYGNGKLANILFTQGLHDRLNHVGLTSVAFHPGNVATNFASDTDSYFRWVYHTVLKVVLIPPARGGANLAHFAAGVPGHDWVSGRLPCARTGGPDEPASQ
jgi:NAD(P)-dependent dehydrogenase (short-subunit alcohol dehydrogenase family)